MKEPKNAQPHRSKISPAAANSKIEKFFNQFTLILD
jgi:hypothetical protein